jgi:hypothetical protein
MRLTATTPGPQLATRWSLTVTLALALLTCVAVAPGETAPVGGQQVAFEDVVGNLRSGDPRVKIDALQMLS